MRTSTPPSQPTASDEVWFAYRTPRPDARVRLFCLPHAGGSASIFRTWSAELGASIEVLPVQLPGREARMGEPPFTRLPPLVDTLVEVVRRRLDKPYALFGHSMGALVGFELARALRRRGLPRPVHLFLASYTAPQVLARTPPAPKTREVEPTLAHKRAQAHAVPGEMTAELLKLVMPTLLADTALCESYTYQEEEPLECPLSVFRGSEDEVREHHIEAWRELTRGSFSTRTFLGDHFFLRETPRGLLQLLRHTLTSSPERLAP